MEVVSSTNQIAHKEHICGLCGLKIKIGERYERQFNKDGGDVWTFKAHAKCMDIATNLSMFYECQDEGLDCDFFREAISEYFRLKTYNIYPNVTFEEKLQQVEIMLK